MLPFQSLLAVLLMLFDTFASFAMDHLWVLNRFLLLQQIVLVCKATGPGSTRHSPVYEIAPFENATI